MVALFWLTGASFAGGTRFCAEDYDGGMRAAWDAGGGVTVESVPDGASVVITWRLFDGYDVVEEQSVRSVSDDRGKWTQVLPLPEVGPLFQVDGPVSLRPWVRVVDSDGREVGEVKLPPRTLQHDGSRLTSINPVVSTIPAEVEAFLPERLRGHGTTRVAVASLRTDAPKPAMVMDNDDKVFDLGGEPATYLNEDLLVEPMSREEVAAILDRLGKGDRIESVLAAQQASWERKQAALDVALEVVR